jgi:hypothetical protein
VQDGGEHEFDVAVVELGESVTKVYGDAVGDARGQTQDSLLALPEQGRAPALRAVIAFAQSTSAIGVVPSVMLVPVSMKRSGYSGTVSTPWRAARSSCGVP